MTREAALSLDDVFGETKPIRGTGRPESGRYGKGKVSASSLAGWYGSSYNLIRWAKREFYDGALEGKTFEELDERATDIGSLVHKLIESAIHGDEPPVIPAEYEEPVRSAFAAWHKWMNQHKMTIVATELSFASDKYGLGGTLDAILRDSDGKTCIGDWKTSATLRSSYLVQLAIYGMLWEEANPDDLLTGGYHLLRFSKTGGNLIHMHFDDLALAKDLALMLRKAYTLANDVKKDAGLAF